MSGYALQRRRGTTAQHSTFTGLIGESSIDTDKKVVVVHDGVKAGGYPLARQEFANVLEYGADPTGASNASPAIQAACNSGKMVIIPPGTYTLDNAITVPNGTIIEGMGAERSIINCYITKAFTTNAEAREIQISNLKIANQVGATGIAGIELIQARHCRIQKVEILDYSTAGSAAIKVDGKTTFAASNQIVDVLLGRNYIGIWLTADIGYQCNHTVIVGGYIYGSVGLKGTANSCGINITLGDTNFIYGTGVEDLDKGIRNLSGNPGGNAFILPRVENCNTKYDTGGTGVTRCYIDGVGTTFIATLPTSAAGLASGSLWRDAGASNVIKMVP